jgi:hypothetical protein
MATRDELLAAVGERYRASSRAEKKTIIDEFASATGYHRKHAMRVLRTGPSAKRSAPRPSRRIYGAAEREALILLWEASDRVCGKRLKAIIPTLIEAMERHGHLALAAEVRTSLFNMSAATIDRALQPQREQCSPRRRRTAAISTIRRSIPVRTFSDWSDPPPGFVEADLVAHSGPVTRGSFVQTLVVTDIASGWTELAPLLVREQTLLVDVLREVRRRLPFPLLGFDTDNDTVFMNETVRDYCAAEKIEFTRCRPYRKNDQAHVEQKNGEIVRRMVGYRRYEGLAAAEQLAKLYAPARLFVNAFQPCFKLAEKTRNGAQVKKRYHKPMTPCDRLLTDPRVDTASSSFAPISIRSGCRPRSAVRNAHWLRSRTRRTRRGSPHRNRSRWCRSTALSLACAPPGKTAKFARHPCRSRRQSAAGAALTLSPPSRMSCGRGSRPIHHCPAGRCSIDYRRSIPANIRTV